MPFLAGRAVEENLLTHMGSPLTKMDFCMSVIITLALYSILYLPTLSA